MFTRDNKINLKGLHLRECEEFFENLGEEKFRAKQLFVWLYQKMKNKFSDMTNFSAELKRKLEIVSYIENLKLSDEQFSSATGTRKFLFELNDGNKIESVLIPESARNTLCVSTQVGCPVYCNFCATGQMGFKRNLSPSEILDQYIQVSLLTEKPITNIVYMGMGEPFLNYENTLSSLEILSSEYAFGISAKKITVSTVGIPDKIKEFANSFFKGKLAFSLHSTNEDTRTKLIPLNKKYSLEENISALEYFYRKTKRRITFEYTLIKGINDSDIEIKGIIKLSKRIPCKINIIPFNSIAHINPHGLAAELRPTNNEEFNFFVSKLRENNLSVFVRNTQGDDIAGACGQLANFNKQVYG